MERLELMLNEILRLRTFCSVRTGLGIVLVVGWLRGRRDVRLRLAFGRRTPSYFGWGGSRARGTSPKSHFEV